MRKNLLLSAWAIVQDVGPRATDIMSGVLKVFVNIRKLNKKYNNFWVLTASSEGRVPV